MRGNNLSDTPPHNDVIQPSPQYSTDISHYGNGLMESVNPNTFNNLGLPRVAYLLCTLQSQEIKDQHVHCYYIRTLYKTIAIRAAFCYLCLTSSCSGNTSTDNQTSCMVSLGILLVCLATFSQRQLFFSPQKTHLINEIKTKL